MATTFVPVSLDRHRGLRWRRFKDYVHAREAQFVDIALPEMSKVCMVTPVLFRQAGEVFVPIALLGTEPNQNAHLAPDFRWVTAYTPALLRGQPFVVIPRGDGQFELHVDSGHVTDDQGEPFFGDDGAPAPVLQSILEFLQQVEAGRHHARIVAEQLGKTGVIKPLTRQGEDGQPETVQGLFTVDEASLMALSDADFAGLRGSGALKFAYHQMLSLETWPTLVALSTRHRAHRDEISKRTAAIYQPVDDGELQIDWSQFKPQPSP